MIRMIDGTDHCFMKVLRKLLITYDGDWLDNSPESKPFKDAGAKRFSFPDEFIDIKDSYR